MRSLVFLLLSSFFISSFAIRCYVHTTTIWHTEPEKSVDCRTPFCAVKQFDSGLTRFCTGDCPVRNGCDPVSKICCCSSDGCNKDFNAN